MQLLASQKEVKRLNGLSDVATKATKGHLKRLERLGTKEEELVQLRKSHTQSNIDLAEMLRLNKILKKKNEATEPFPHRCQQKIFSRPFPKFILLSLKRNSKLQKLGL